MPENNEKEMKTKLRQISDDELKKILEEHKKWFESAGEVTHQGERADLSFTDLSGRSFTEANLRGADLTEASLEGANLSGADLAHAKLKGTCLKYANLEKATLDYANLKGANLFDARLSGSRVQWAELDGAALGFAKLELVLLAESSLKRVRARNVNLKYSFLTEANLEDADLESAEMNSANLSEAILWGADLQGADFENTNVRGIKYNRKGLYRGIRVATCYGSDRFRRFAQHQSFIEELRESSKAGKALYWIWLIFADCGRTPWAWIGWSLFFVFAFGLSFFCMGPQAFDIRSLDHSFGSMMYYSVVTFTTLGFGDITPAKGYAAYVVMAEVVIGYLMLGGLISILGNTLFRRG